MGTQAKDRIGADELLAYKAFADELADAAAAAALPHFRAQAAVDLKSDRHGFDPVTAADKGAERAMRALIEARYPGDGIIGEEYAAKPSQSGRTWVLDPIDGTGAFVAGLPSWGTLIALNDGDGPVLGLAVQPHIGERFSGVLGTAGARATLNGAPIRTRGCGDLGEAVLATTSPSYFSASEGRVYERVERAARAVRYGWDWYAYAVLAAGHIDLVIESGLAPYDIQALIPIIEAAGGVVTDWQGGPAGQGGRILAAGDPRMHAAALELLSAAGSD